MPGNVVKAVQIPTQIADEIAAALRADGTDAEQRRRDGLTQLEQRQRVVTGKLDRGYEDLMSGAHLGRVLALQVAGMGTGAHVDRPRDQHQSAARTGNGVNAKQILELAEKAEIFCKSGPSEQRRLLETVLSNLYLRRRNHLCDLRFALRPAGKGNETGDWLGGRDSSQVAANDKCREPRDALDALPTGQRMSESE